MATKKNKFAADRAMQSKLSELNRIKTDVYMTNPKTVITVQDDLPANVVTDLRHAIDEVLKYHGY